MNLGESLANIPVLKDRQSIPKHKRRAQWTKTLVGGVIFVGGFFLPRYLGFDWKVAVGVSAFGAFVTSQQLVTDFLRAVPQAIATIVAAFAGKKPE